MIIDEEPYPGPLTPEIDMEEVKETFAAIGKVGTSFVEEVGGQLTRQFAGLGESFRKLQENGIIMHTSSSGMNGIYDELIKRQMEQQRERERAVAAYRKNQENPPGVEFVMDPLPHYTAEPGSRRAVFTEQQVSIYANILGVPLADAEEILNGMGVDKLPPISQPPPKGRPSKGPRERQHFDRRGKKKF